MTQFEENNPKQLKEFIHQFRKLIDEFHPNIYLIDGVFEGADIIEQAISEKLNKSEPDDDQIYNNFNHEGGIKYIKDEWQGR
jgi:hypothetical protein